jgi:hypothetical protein
MAYRTKIRERIMERHKQRRWVARGGGGLVGAEAAASCFPVARAGELVANMHPFSPHTQTQPVYRHTRPPLSLIIIRHEELVERSRHWIPREAFVERIKQAVDNPVSM